MGSIITYKLKIRHIATLQGSKRIQRHRAYENHQHSTQSVVLFCFFIIALQYCVVLISAVQQNNSAV